MTIETNIKNKSGPWSNHNKLKEEDAPPVEEVQEFIYELAKKRLDFAAAITVMYLSASRAREVLEGYHKDGSKYASVRRRDIKYEVYRGHTFLILRTKIEKHSVNRGKVEHNPIFKHAYIDTELDIYKPFVYIINQYLARLPNDDPDYPVFRFAFSTMKSYFNKHFGFSTHIFRHWRCHHLARYHNYNEFDLITYVGWSAQSNMPRHYTRASAVTLMDKQIRSAP